MVVVLFLLDRDYVILDLRQHVDNCVSPNSANVLLTLARIRCLAR